MRTRETETADGSSTRVIPGLGRFVARSVKSLLARSCSRCPLAPVVLKKVEGEYRPLCRAHAEDASTDQRVKAQKAAREELRAQRR